VKAAIEDVEDEQVHQAGRAAASAQVTVKVTEHHHHHHHHVTQSSHSINTIGPAPLWSGRKKSRSIKWGAVALQGPAGSCRMRTLLQQQL
jgi:hypothetical protein